MMKAEKTLFYTCLFLIVCLCVMFVINSKSQAEKKRYKTNYEVSQNNCKLYRTNDSLSAISIGELTLKKNELEDANAKLVNTCDELNIKLKRLESASTTSGTTVIEKVIPIHDTIIRVDTSFITYQSFSYKDTWNNIQGLIDGTNIRCTIAISDTLQQVVYRIPRKFLFFKFGCKEIRQECISSNPYTTLNYSQYIKIK